MRTKTALRGDGLGRAGRLSAFGLTVAVFAWAGVFAANAGESGRIFLPDLLPANTIACIVPPDEGKVERDYSQTVFARIANLPEMGPFLRDFEESRRQFAADISQTANVPPQLAYDLVQSRLGLALINITMGRDGKPLPEYVIAISLQAPADRNTVFSAVMALLNRPEVVRTVLESQGIDPNLPLKTLAQEETISGYPPILRIGPNIRVASVGNLVMLYHGPNSDGIRKIFDAASKPATALSRNTSFQAAYRGAEAQPGTSFCYFNIPRLTAILDALGLSQAGRVADALGFGSVQSVGMAGEYHQDGVRHTMFLHIPGGAPAGLMGALVPMPSDASAGMESYGTIIPASAEAFMSLRVDMPTLMREIPYLLDALGAVTRPGGVTSMVANERILGVPLTDVIQTLGEDVVIRPHDDSQVLMFHNANVAGFESVIGRMEKNAGERFSSINVGGYIVRYFNRRADLSKPLAPAFCLVPRQQGSNQGLLFIGTHPQAVVSLIQETTATREPVSQTQDFLRAGTGMGGNFSLYYYNGNRDCYRRVYNFLLPVMSLWSSSTRYPVDTGLLPTANSVMPAVFGSTMGIKCLPEGMKIQAFSPIGFGAVFVQLADKLVVSNPLVIGYTYAMMETWLQTLPAW